MKVVTGLFAGFVISVLLTTVVVDVRGGASGTTPQSCL